MRSLLLPTVTGKIGALTLFWLNSPKTIIKIIGIIFKIVITDCILLENLVPIKLILNKNKTSITAIKLEYLASIPNNETN